VIVGTKDRLVPTRDLDDWCRLLPDVRAERVKGAGHVLPEEAAERVNEVLVGFLTERRAGMGNG
jgi:pimeloyl-ACP methyl ester carboxylesterase